MRLTARAEALARQVLAELLVAEDRQAFLQAQLEPVAAGHAVAGPVVEVLVAHHDSMLAKSVSVAVAWLASTYLVLKMLALVLHGPMLKSLVATIMKRSRSSGRPKRASSQAMLAISEFMACSVFFQVARAHVDLQQVRLPGAAR